MECEVIRLNDQVAVDIGPGERVVAIEVLDASELTPSLKEAPLLMAEIVASDFDDLDVFERN